MEVGPPPEVNTEVDPPEVNTEVDPLRSGCRRGGGRGPAEKYCWASGQYALEKRLPCCFVFHISKDLYLAIALNLIFLHKMDVI